MPAGALTRRFPSLGIRDFRLLLADRLLAPGAFAFSLVGVSFAVLKETSTARHPTGSTADLAYVLAAQVAPALVFLMIGGVVADRVAPQKVIVAANLMIAAGEGMFGLLVLAGRPSLWLMIVLEMLTGTGMSLFYPASQALLPRLVPAGLLQEASAISRLVMNAATMAGAALAGECVAVFGPGWALLACGVGMTGTVPLLLAIRAPGAAREQAASMLHDLRDGWSEFRSHTWLWVTTLQFSATLAGWYGGFQVLGPAVAKAHLGGPKAWGLIAAAEAVGLVIGGLAALRFAPRRPILFTAVCGATIALSPLSLAAPWPLVWICVTSLGLGIVMEMMMVIWTVVMATKIPADRLARVSAYDALGTIGAMPAGALVAGPIAAVIGIPATEYGAAALIAVAAALTLIPREIRTMTIASPPAAGESGGTDPAGPGIDARERPGEPAPVGS